MNKHRNKQIMALLLSGMLSLAPAGLVPAEELSGEEILSAGEDSETPETSAEELFSDGEAEEKTEAEPTKISIVYDKNSVKAGEAITVTYSFSGGNLTYEELGYYWSEYVEGAWTTDTINSFAAASGTLSYVPQKGSKVKLELAAKDEHIEITDISDVEVPVEYDPISISVTYDKASVKSGEEITAAYSVTGGNKNYKELVYYWAEYTDGEWVSTSVKYLPKASGTISYTPSDGSKVRLWIHATDTNGLKEDVYGAEVPVEEAESEKKNGLVLDEDGQLRMYKDDQIDTGCSGIVEYNGGRFFIARGEMCSEANGLNLYDGKWYFLSHGQIQTQYTGLVQYDGEWFYITDGVLDSSKNGLVDYDGSKFLVSEGRIRYDVNGLWQDFDGSWYFLALGQVQTQHTGVAQYDGEFFYVINGKLAAEFNGTIDYDGATFRVIKGQLYGNAS